MEAMSPPRPDLLLDCPICLSRSCLWWEDIRRAGARAIDRHPRRSEPARQDVIDGFAKQFVADHGEALRKLGDE